MASKPRSIPDDHYENDACGPGTLGPPVLSPEAQQVFDDKIRESQERLRKIRQDRDKA